MRQCSTELSIILVSVVVVNEETKVGIAYTVVVTTAVMALVTRCLLLVSPAQQLGSDVVLIEAVGIVELEAHG